MKIGGFKNITKKLIVLNFSIFSLIFSLISGCDRTINRQISKDRQDSSAELIISAAASMQDVLNDIKTLYLKQHPQVNITFNFGSSGSLQHQIEQGAPIDLFISAAPQQMDNLAEKGLLSEETRHNLVKNQMVLAVPKGDRAINNFADLSKRSTKQIALGEPNSVPAGKYAQEILTSLDLTDKIKPKTVYGKDVRQVLNYVATENVDAGIVYRTDAVNNKQVKIVTTAPETTHSPVVYPIAIVKDSNHRNSAKQMLQFLFTPEAQAIFRQHGFIPVGNEQLTMDN